MASGYSVSYGLSPRMRGNPAQAGMTDGAAGSIPAYAGEPSHSGIVCAACQVYPRVCGGTAANPWAARRRMGLSPRMRGNR